MDLNQIAIFTKVAELSSFTKAGKELGMEKSNVSQKISQLEARLGVRLLNRTTRSVSLTEAGTGYYEHCVEIMAKVEEAEYFAESLTSEPKGNIVMTAPSNLGPFITKSILVPFLKQYSLITIELNLTNRKIDLNKEGYDLAIRGDLDAPKDSSDILKRIIQSKTQLFASNEYLQKYGKPETVEALKLHEMIIFSPEDDFKKQVVLKAYIGKKEIKLVPRYRVKVNDLAACEEFTLSGAGIARLPTLFIQHHLQNKALIPVLPELEFYKATIYAVYPSRRLKSAKINALLKFLSQLELTDEYFKI